MRAIPKNAGLLGLLITITVACGAEGPDVAGDRPFGTTGSGASSSTTSFSTSTSSTVPTTTGTIGTSSTSGSGGSAGGAPVGGPIKALGSYDKLVVTAPTPPPPISGGTLAILASGHKAAVADPDRDQVVLVDLDALVVSTTIPLDKGDEPGRLVEDGAGRVHVALRGAGAIATIDAAGALLRRTPVCNHPRGLAYDRTSDVVHVACAGGELISLPAAGGAPVRQLRLDRDLRDIVIDGTRLLVSRFRAAELLVVEPDGQVSQRLRPPKFTGPDPSVTFSGAVAWRTVAAPGGGALMVLQGAQDSTIVPQPGGYGGIGCGGGIVKSGVSLFKSEGSSWIATSLPTTLPVDIAVSPDGTTATVAGAGVPPPPAIPLPVSQPVVSVSITPPTIVLPPTPMSLPDGGPPSRDAGVPCSRNSVRPTEPPAVAVAFDALGRLVRQTREPALRVGDTVIKLPGNAIEDTGHELFHLATFSGIACASCHPEGHEDGHVWKFSGIGDRRTQTIGGGILGTEPFHWDGDMGNFDVLAHQVFVGRMSGPMLMTEHVQALANWIDKIPAWKPAAGLDAAAVERGRTLFASADVGCATCHAGAKMTNNTTVNVGSGNVQVPSLRGVGYRTPLMHTGCALTVAERLDLSVCGGGELHGHTVQLAPAARADLVAYLESL